MSNYLVDDILQSNNKKKIKSGTKGKTGELAIVSMLNERFSETLSNNPSIGKFSRSLGSGNRWSQATLSNEAKKIYSGDIICSSFRFAIESKRGYDIDLNSCFNSGNKQIDEFLDQIKRDSESAGKSPLLIWKKDRRPPIVIIKKDEIKDFTFEYVMFYRDWAIMSLSELLKLPDNFFFNISVSSS